METIDGTMEQEDVSELPGGPTEVSDPAPMVLDEEEQLIVDESAPSVAAAESFSALSLTDASPPSVDSTGRPTPVQPSNGVLPMCHWHRQYRRRFSPNGALEATEQTYSATQENPCAICGSSEKGTTGCRSSPSSSG